MTPAEDSIRIVIPCRNSDQTIEACVAAACRTGLTGVEVVVVDDGENSVLGMIEKKYPCRIVRSSGALGAGAARNVGARGFKGSILVFIDADVELRDARTIASLVGPIRTGRAAATVGCYTGSRRNNFAETYKHRYLAYTYGRRSGTVSNSFWTALCAVDRGWFETLGGYIERYAWAGPEDIEFGIALTQRGGVIAAVPEAQGHHLASLDLVGLLANDLQKGSEDVYIHWTKKVALTDNRHVTVTDMAAVALASLCIAVLPLLSFLGTGTLLLAGMLYAAVRFSFVRGAFGSWGARFFLQSFLVCFLLDLIRALAVLTGTLAWAAGATARRVKKIRNAVKKISHREKNFTT